MHVVAGIKGRMHQDHVELVHRDPLPPPVGQGTDLLIPGDDGVQVRGAEESQLSQVGLSMPAVS